MRKILVIICTFFIARITHADTKNLQWMVDGSVYAQTSCNDGADVILPTPPSKPGYIFQGWSPGYYLSTYDTSINGNIYYGRNADDTCYFLNPSIMTEAQQQACTLSEYSDLSPREWKTLFDYGTVRGESACSASPGATMGDVGNPDISNPSNGGAHCWCRVTGFIPAGKNGVGATLNSKWTFSHTLASVSNCTKFCGGGCGARALANSSLRNGLYGIN